MRRSNCSSSSTSWASATCCRTELRVEPRRQAEEWEQALGVEEERELDDPAVDDLEHLQRPRVIAAARSARLVLPECGRAVRANGRNDARAATTGARPDPPTQDVVPAAQPHVERRHGLSRVLLDQRGER